MRLPDPLLLSISVDISRDDKRKSVLTAAVCVCEREGDRPWVDGDNIR